MPKLQYTRTFKIDLDTDVDADEDLAAQAVPILGSHDFRRFTILIENIGAGVATLKGSTGGSATKATLASITSDEGFLDNDEVDASGFVAILNAAGDAVFDENGNGLYQVELVTHLDGGLLLDLTGITKIGDGVGTVTVSMAGNVRTPGAPRGA